MSFIFSVFTPTYNRAHTLHRVYGSLKSQTFKNFEWIVVDDGSTDNTRELVNKWKTEASFPIRYFFQKNNGKHIAINKGVNLAKGKFFIIIDSDDAFVPQSLEKLYFYWNQIPQNQQQYYSGICVLCMTPDGKIVGDKFPFSPFDTRGDVIKYKFKVKGEKWGMIRTEIMKEFPFPEKPLRTLYPELLVWRKISQKYLTRHINEPLRIYYEDQPGYIRAKKVKYPWSCRIKHKFYLDEDISKCFFYSPFEFLRSAIHYSRFSFHLKILPLLQLKDLKNFYAKILVFFSIPFSFLVYLKDKFIELRFKNE